jgi:hypothetical protein
MKFFEDQANSELYKARISRFRRHSNYVTIFSVVYALLVVQFTPLFKDFRYPLEFFVLLVGSIFFIIYQYLPEDYFKPNMSFFFNTMGLLASAAVVQFTGGLASPFIFLYTVIILAALVSMSFWRAGIIFILVIELFIAHFFTTPTLGAIEPGSVQDLFFSISRLTILATYVGLLVVDLFSEEAKNQELINKLKGDLAESKLTSDLDRSIASREPLSEILNKTLSETADQMKADMGLVLLRHDLSNSWRARATFRLSHEFTSKINPELAENELMKTVEKTKKTTLVSRGEIKKVLPSLQPLGISSLLISPFIFNSRLFGSIVFVNLNSSFSNEDRDFLDHLTSKFSATVSNALSLEAQDNLFLENEKELEAMKKKFSTLESKQQKKKTVTQVESA